MMARPEFTIKDKEDKLFEKMLEAGFFTFAIPVIEFDAPTRSGKRYMIVDGHHRFAVLCRLDIQNIPIVIYDYKTIKINAFYARSDIAWDHIPSVASVQHNECSYEQGLDLVEQSKAHFMVAEKQGDGLRYSVLSPRENAFGLDDLIEAKQALFDSISGRYQLEFIPQDQWNFSNLAPGEILLIQRPYDHSEVIHRVSRDLVFPQKSTRHILPFEANIGIPLQLLRDWPLEWINKLSSHMFELAQHLN